MVPASKPAETTTGRPEIEPTLPCAMSEAENPVLIAFCGLTAGKAGPSSPRVSGEQAMMTRPAPLLSAYTVPAAAHTAALTAAGVAGPVGMTGPAVVAASTAVQSAFSVSWA